MVNGSPIYFYKTKSLSNLRPSSLIAVKVDGEDFFSLYVTDKTGIPYPIKDETGGGGGGTITAIQNTDGNLEITGTTTKTINVSPSLLSLINSALQPGDNVSELSNDAGYITLADIPTFNPTDYDLEDFTNTSADPFARMSDLGGAVDSVNGQTGVVVLDSDDISEGTTNLYFTDARALGAIPDATPTVKGIAKLYTSLGSNTDGAVDQNTVNSALALKANLQNVEQIIRSKSNGTFGSHTGDTAETVIAVINIDANEFEAGDWMTLFFSGEKDAWAGNVTWKLRAGVNGNTSDSQIALLNATAANSKYCALYRARPQFLTGNQLRIWSSGSSANTDISNSGTPTLASLTPTSAWKLTLTAQLTVLTETASLTGYRIGKIKSF